MVTAKLSYEELRRQRLEDNKKRMEELRLPQLSQALNTSRKPSQMKRSIPRKVEEQVVIVRRSNRVAHKPIPDYNESGRRDLLNLVYASDEDRAYAVTLAEILESSLGSAYPTLVKPMVQSHVTNGFWLGVPVHFCKKYLPRSDENVTLVDEEGLEYPVVYLARKTGLSDGWKGFAVDHELVDGDALVFQLIRPTVLKVYIIRVNTFEASINR